jgi:hypothetical protein
VICKELSLSTRTRHCTVERAKKASLTRNRLTIFFIHTHISRERGCGERRVSLLLKRVIRKVILTTKAHIGYSMANYLMPHVRGTHLPHKVREELVKAPMR